MKKVIFIFLDGIGIGKADPENPFYNAGAEYFPLYTGGCRLPDGTPIEAIDACLGVEGMPMSATGQTTLFTGTNAPQVLGEHMESYPDKRMRKIIKEKSLFSQLRRKNLKPRFLNAFPGASHLFTPQHIQIRSDGEFRFSSEFRSQVRHSISVTTCMMLANYMVPYSMRDIKEGEALFHDFTNLSLNRGATPLVKNSGKNDLPVFSPEKAAEILYNTSRKYDCLLFEFFQSDLYGHGFEMLECVDLIRRLNSFLGRLISLLDKEEDTLVVTSDHGNLEDSSTQMHTLNPVPLYAWGNSSQRLRESIHNIADVTPSIVELFDGV